jgi:DNA-directed RNA polymerase subunit RPC12/RpoP
MVSCTECGGKLKRVHRTFTQRFSLLAVFECADCRQRMSIPRRYQYHLGQDARCPQCGTTRLTRLKTRDGIDPMQSGVLNLWERWSSGRLFHCCFCRIQFYDRRPLAPRGPVEPEAPPPEPVKSPQGTAISGE